jgi:hypothetical protein
LNPPFNSLMTDSGKSLVAFVIACETYFLGAGWAFGFPGGTKFVVIPLTAAAIAAMNSGVKACGTAGKGAGKGAGRDTGKGSGKDVGKGAGNNMFDAEGTMRAPRVLNATCQGWPASPRCGVNGAYMRVRNMMHAASQSG